MRWLVHKDDEEKRVYLQEVKDWLISNKLYLRPEIRDNIQEAINTCDNYPIYWRDWQRAAQNSAKNPINSDNESKKLKEKFDILCILIPQQIEEVVDKYYKSIDK